MDFKFKPEDFAPEIFNNAQRPLDGWLINDEIATELANRRLAEMLEQAPTVYKSSFTDAWSETKPAKCWIAKKGKVICMRE